METGRALERLVRRGHRVLCFGRPQTPVSGVEYLAPSREQFARALLRAQGVIGSAGNHLPAECAMLGLPMLALHRRDDAEQRMNGVLIEHAGIGVSSSLNALDERLIRTFERRLDQDGSALAKRTLALPSTSAVTTQLLREIDERGSSKAATRGSRLTTARW